MRRAMSFQPSAARSMAGQQLLLGMLKQEET